MNKIPTLFVRNPEDRRYVLPEVNPGCEWVLAGEGTATRKYDGTCVRLDEVGKWWARREVKPGKTPPPNYVPISTDETTGKTVGWEPIEQSAFAKHFEQALDFTRAGFSATPVGTYELVGPKVNGNPENWEHHGLIAHANAAVVGMPREITYGSLRSLFTGTLGPLRFEGVVWHHPDGRMAKLKVRDFPA